MPGSLCEMKRKALSSSTPKSPLHYLPPPQASAPGKKWLVYKNNVFVEEHFFVHDISDLCCNSRLVEVVGGTVEQSG